MKRVLLAILLCTFCTSAFAQFQQEPMLGEQINSAHPLGDPVAFWPLNEGAGTIVNDLSGNGNIGTFSGTAPSWGGGKFGSGVILPGTDEEIVITDKTISIGRSGKGYSIFCWAYDNDLTTDNRMIFQKGAGANYEFALWLNSDESLQVETWQLGGASQGAVTSAASLYSTVGWHFYGFVYKQATYLKVFLDGVEVAEDTTFNGEVGDGSADLTLGGPMWTGSQWNCTISHAMAWDRPLSASEVAELYREPFCMFERDPIELWTGATSVGVPAGNAGIMTPNTGFWGPTF